MPCCETAHLCPTITQRASSAQVHSLVKPVATSISCCDGSCVFREHPSGLAHTSHSRKGCQPCAAGWDLYEVALGRACSGCRVVPLHSPLAVGSPVPRPSFALSSSVADANDWPRWIPCSCNNLCLSYSSSNSCSSTRSFVNSRPSSVECPLVPPPPRAQVHSKRSRTPTNKQNRPTPPGRDMPMRASASTMRPAPARPAMPVYPDRLLMP
eukprot:scaffold1603_cov415-Prasinococcus_capsulatus_cf.AAC.23